jgi:phytoene synthase
MDLRPVAFETFDRLADYCYHVAGAVGLACIHLWGFHDERAVAAAIDCGTAFQITNILRDLREDAARGRVYLPQEDLARFDLSADDLAQGRRDERFERLMQFEVARAREYYARARPLYDYLDPPGKPILETMLRIYGGLLDEIERRRYDVFTRRVELSCGRKLYIAGRVLLRQKLRSIFQRR